jgi:hypothetical protein
VLGGTGSVSVGSEGSTGFSLGGVGTDDGAASVEPAGAGAGVGGCADGGAALLGAAGVGVGAAAPGRAGAGPAWLGAEGADAAVLGWTRAGTGGGMVAAGI